MNRCARILGLSTLLLLASLPVFPQDAPLQGTTREGIYGCRTREDVVALHAARQAMQFDRTKAFYRNGSCRDVEPGKTAVVLKDGEWGSPIQVRIDGRTFWIMQYMLTYDRPKEDENDYSKVLFAAGVGVECNWAPKSRMVIQLQRLGDFAVEKLGISPDRAIDLQTLHIPGGRSFAKKYGCSHPYAQMMKLQYGPFFAGEGKHKSR